jgi:hypothetical protein
VPIKSLTTNLEFWTEKREGRDGEKEKEERKEERKESERREDAERRSWERKDKSFFLATPVSRLWAKHRTVPRQLKNTDPVRKIEMVVYYESIN